MTLSEEVFVDVVMHGQQLDGGHAQFAQILDDRLSDRTFLAGESFTMWDIPAATTVHRWYALDIHHPELPNLYRWYQFMKERQSFRAIVMTPLS